MLTIPALATERFAQTSSLPVCLLPQRGTLASRPTALCTAHSAQCRVALCIMESAGEAFDLNCMPTADSRRRLRRCLRLTPPSLTELMQEASFRAFL